MVSSSLPHHRWKRERTFFAGGACYISSSLEEEDDTREGPRYTPRCVTTFDIGFFLCFFFLPIFPERIFTLDRHSSSERAALFCCAPKDERERERERDVFVEGGGGCLFFLRGMSQQQQQQQQQQRQSSSSTTTSSRHQNQSNHHHQSGHQKRALNHQEQLKEKARSIAHYLRASSKSTLEQRSARLRDDRVSFFRGKDFYRSLRDDPDFVEKECTIGGKSMDDKIEYLGNVLLHCGLIQRCQRIYKEPRKGRTKRVKYPHYLEKTKNQTFAYPTNDDDSFYAWTYDQPMSWAFLITSWAVAILVMLMCLFPLAPIWFKKIILYLCVAILSLFTVIILVRAVVFAAVWLVSGRHFWILPNIASDEIPINEVFSPMWMFDDLDASGKVVGKIGLVQRILGTGDFLS